MERKGSIKQFICRSHPGEPIRKFSYKNGVLGLHCVECVLSLDTIEPRSLLPIEELLKLAVKTHANVTEISDKIRNLPDGIENVLTSEHDHRNKLKPHIENEKAKVNKAFDTLKNSFLDLLEKKRVESLKALDDQLLIFDMNFKMFSDKIQECKIGSTKKVTFDSLVDEINRLQETAQLESFLTLLKNDMEEKEGYIGLKSDEIVSNVHEGLKNMSCELSGLVELGPCSSLGESKFFNEVLEGWNKNITNCIKELQANVKNPIPKLTIAPTNFDSLITKERNHINLLKQWVLESGFDVKKFELLYRGTQHGFSYFHSTCDYKGSPTIVLIEATTGEKFGGYSPLEWVNTGGPYFPTDKSFLFSLDTAEKLKVKNEQYAVYSNTAWGPCWGNVSDLAISTTCNSSGSYSDTGNAYYQLTGRKYFTPERNFVVKEMEVFLLK